jgi:hypothetical protein
MSEITPKPIIPPVEIEPPSPALSPPVALPATPPIDETPAPQSPTVEGGFRNLPPPHADEPFPQCCAVALIILLLIIVGFIFFFVTCIESLRHST